MAAPIGNEFWKLRSKHGCDQIFSDPNLLWDCACEYFQWCTENPLRETKAFAYQGDVTTVELPKMRAFTYQGLCLYLGVHKEYLNDLEEKYSALSTKEAKDFSRVIRDIRQTIYVQKFEGAAADLLNATIVSRELGLADKSDLKLSGDRENPIQHQHRLDFTQFTDAELERMASGSK